MTITPADSLDLLIAHGPPDATDFAKQIAGLPGAYYAGLDEAYKRRNENAFQGGVPTTTIIGPDGKPQTVPDYNAAGIKALELGGTQAVAPFATLAGLDINRQNQLGDVTAARIRAGEEVPGVPGAQPSTPGSNLPPPSARITVQPANRPPGSSNGMSATSVNAAVSQGGFSGAEAGSLMTRIAQGLGVDPDQNLDPVKQAQVATAVQRAIAARQQRTPAQPPAASAAPSQSSFNDRFAGDNAPITRPPVAAVPAGIDPNSPIPPRYQGGREQEFISALQRSLATGTKEGREATAAKLKAIEEYQAKNADIERAARTEEGKKQVETLSKLADAGSEAQGHTAQIEQIRQLGRRVGYGIVPKAQSLLGRFGIPTKGLDDIQAYESAIDYMAPQLRPQGSGRLLQNELNSFKSALGGLLTTPSGREIMANNLELLSKYKLELARIASGSELAAVRMNKILNFNPPHLQVAVGPKSGYVDPQTGHTFIGKTGGDPNDPANWK